MLAKLNKIELSEEFMSLRIKTKMKKTEVLEAAIGDVL